MCVVSYVWRSIDNQMIVNLIKRNNISGDFCNDPKLSSTNTYTRTKNRVPCVFHVRSMPPRFVHELLPNLKSVDLEESPFDTYDDPEALKAIIGPVDIGRHRLMCGNSVSQIGK
ncbi:hypothetical protein WR25_09846 [Diploscapter pachys]|uniref:Uncharacterized protein n=1 Tax=Diploscapter pachys TaxID=2018661 RepID=A0A2A2JIN7_9BILA|nr:hypothetical protein WR25_09846 [Diploscapter pachys]